MAEEEFNSSLGFDATEALKTFKLLEVVVGAYTKAMRANVKATDDFNNSQQQVDSILAGLEEGARGARVELERLAKAQRLANAAATKSARIVAAAKNLDNTRRRNETRAFLNSELQPNRANVPAPKLASFDKASADFENLVAKTKVGQAQIRTILNNLGGNYRGVAQQIRNSLIKVVQAQAQLGGSNLQRANNLLLTLGNTGQVAGRRIAQGLNQASAASHGLLLSWQSVGRIFISQAIFRAIASVTGQLGDSVQRARDLQIALAEIQTIAPPDLRNASLSDVARITNQLSGDFGIDQVEAANAVYEAFSNQVGNTAETIRFMQTAARFATGTLTNLADTGDLLSGVMNAYGLSNENAERTADLLFKTIDFGRVKGDQLANTLGRVIPLGAQLGVELEEIFAVIASTTIQGVLPDDALTQLQNILKGLIKPTEDLKKKFEELGISSAEVGIARFGLVGFIQEVTKGATSVEQLSKQFDDVRELRGVLSALSQEGELFARTFQKIKEESEGASQAASEIVLNTPAAQLQKSIEQFKNVLTADVGNEVIDALNKIVGGFGGVENAAKLATAAVVAGATAISIGLGIGVVTAFGAALAAAKVAGIGMLVAFGPVSVLLAGITAAALVTALTFNRLKSSGNGARSLANDLDKARRAADEFAKTSIASQQQIDRISTEASRINVQASIEAISKRLQGNAQILDDATRLEKAITRGLADQVKAREKLVEKFVTNVQKSIEDAADNIKKLSDNSRDFEFNVREGRVDRNLNAANDPQKAQILKDEVNKLLEAARRAANLGEDSFAQGLIESALSRSEQLAQLQGFRSQGETEINKVLRAQQGLTDELIKKENEKAASAKKALPELEKQSQSIQEQSIQYQNLLKEIQKGDLTGDQRTDLQNQLEALAKSITDSTAKFGATGLTGFDDQLKQVREAFNDLNGQKVTLQFATEQSLGRVQELLNQTRFSAKIEFELAEATGIAPGPNQAKDIQNLLPKMISDLDLARKNAVGFNAAMHDSQTALFGADKAFQALSKTATEFPQNPSTTFGIVDQEDLKRRIEGSKFALQMLESLRTQFKAAVAANDTEGLLNIQNTISAIAVDESENAGLAVFIEQLKQLSAQITAYVSAKAKLEETGQQATIADKLATDIARITETLNASGIADNLIKQNTLLQQAGPASDSGLGKVKANQDAVNQSIREGINAQRILNELQQAAPKQSPVQGKSRGGPISFFASGGLARGTDVIPAMLSPGEFIVNPASTRKFFSELTAINAGRTPVYREQGGPVTNNNFGGDIVLNLPAGTQNPREIMTGLRREIRRKTSRF